MDERSVRHRLREMPPRAGAGAPTTSPRHVGSPRRPRSAPAPRRRRARDARAADHGAGDDLGHDRAGGHRRSSRSGPTGRCSTPTTGRTRARKLLQNEQIREATANYLVEQLYANVNVEEEIKKRLPKEVQGAGGPAGRRLVRTGATEVAKRALANGQGPGSLEDGKPRGRPDARQRSSKAARVRSRSTAGSSRSTWPRSSPTSPTASGCPKWPPNCPPTSRT